MQKWVATLAFVALSLPALAASSSAPDPSLNPVLKSFLNAGARIFYLGNESGADGWFILKGDGVQTVYATPDNQHIIVGVLFGDAEDNDTMKQVSALIKTNKEAAAALSTAAQTPIAAASAPAVPDTPGERLLADLSRASTVVIGNANTPEILMIMDPRCPHCQATWKALQSSVRAGKLHLRFVPIGAADSDSEREAAVLLKSPDPLNAWTRFVNGDAAALGGAADDAALAGVEANHELIDKWKITVTPYMVYRGRDGKVKIMFGEPRNTAILLADLGVL